MFGLSFCLRKSVDSLKDGNEEASRANLDERTKKAESWHRDAALRSRYAKPAQPITCATFAQDVIEGRAKVSQAHDHKHQPIMFGPASLVNGSLTSERERMAAQVFQPGHRYCSFFEIDLVVKLSPNPLLTIYCCFVDCQQ